MTSRLRRRVRPRMKPLRWRPRRAEPRSANRQALPRPPQPIGEGPPHPAHGAPSEFVLSSARWPGWATTPAHSMA